VPQSCKSAKTSVAFGDFLMRIRTTAWKAMTAFHTYAQGPAARDPYEEDFTVREGTKNRLACSPGKGVENLCPTVVLIGRFWGDRHWPLLR
jgi:hypothetical protein